MAGKGNPPKPTLGYPSRSSAAVALRAQGLRPAEIAARMSAEAGERISAKNVSSMIANGRRAAGGGVMSVALSGDAWAAVSRAARLRGEHARTLAGRILDLVATEGMIDAVLDDGVATPTGTEGDGA